jgi:hypothetical protein
VGKVMSQLSGASKSVVGTADLATPHSNLCSHANLLLWNRSQKNFLNKQPLKVIISSDFGCGKSLLLQNHMLTCVADDPTKTDNFLISFLRSSSKPPFVRTIQDVSNRMRYEQENVTVIDMMDIMDRNSSIRSRLSLPSTTSEDPFKFLYDLTDTYPLANIAVDEAPLKELVQKDKVHSDAFHGTFWIAVSAVALYDFSDQQDTTDLSKLKIENEQGFARIHLDKNMRNGNRILEA